MSTLFHINERLMFIDDNLGNLARTLVEIISQTYEPDKSIPDHINNTNNFDTSYFVVDSEFENVLLGIRFDGGFIISLEGRGSDNPYDLTMRLEENLIDELPLDLKEELEENFYKSIGNRE